MWGIFDEVPEDSAPPSARHHHAPMAPRLQGRALHAAQGVASWLARPAKIAFGRQKQLRAHANQRAKQLHAALAPKMQDTVSQVFGFGPLQAQEKSRDVVVDGALVHMPRLGHEDPHKRADVDRAVCSHASAQAQALATFVGAPGAAAVFSTNIFDDASMWVRKPAGADRILGVDNAGPGPPGETMLARKLKLKGHNVFMPVLNLVERVFVRREHASHDGLLGTEVHSPCQVLSNPNASTVRDRWSNWSCITARGAGTSLCAGVPESELQSIVMKAPWKIVVLVRDNLGLNSSIIGMEEKYVASLAVEGMDPDAIPSILSVECAAHSCVLCQQPFMKSQDNVPGNMVTLAHLLESGRTHSNFVDALKKEIARPGNFDFFEVDELPPDVLRLREKHRAILELTNPAMDLTEDEKSLILDADSGDWDLPVVLHHCVKDRCLLGCRGCPVRSRRLVTQAIVLSIGGRMPVPLLYRWKGFERAAAFLYRGRRQRDLLQRAMRRLFSKGLDDAGSEGVLVNDDVNVAAALALGEEVDFGTARRVRAKKALAFLEGDPSGGKIKKALILNEPIQSFLNAAFAADAATNSFVQMSCELHDDTTSQTAAWVSAKELALQRNLEVVSGDRGRSVVRKFWAMLQDPTGEPWAQMELAVADKSATCMGVIVTMADAFRRLVHHYEQPKFLVFNVCARPFCDAVVKEIANSILSGRCVDCLGAFARVWLRRLLDKRTWLARRAWATLQDLIACMPVSSIKVSWGGNEWRAGLSCFFERGVQQCNMSLCSRLESKCL